MGKVPTPKNSNLYLLHIEMSFKEEDVTTSLTLSLTLSFMLPCSYEKKIMKYVHISLCKIHTFGL